MPNQFNTHKKFALLALAACFAALPACHARVLINFDNPGPGADGSSPGATPCGANPTWLPDTPPLTLYEPAPHPAPDCPFYQGGVQNFLIATQPQSDGDPAFASYATIDDVFSRLTPLPSAALAPPGARRGTSSRAWLGVNRQPGFHSMIIDEDGHALYTGVHLNQVFVNFMMANNLQTAAAVQSANPNLSLPPGLVELKSVWKDIDPTDGVKQDYTGYITTTAWVARLTQDPVTGQVTEDRNNPRFIKVALITLHVGYTLPRHPEIIWTTFEHVDAAGEPDVAPSSILDPAADDPLNYRSAAMASAKDFLLYRGGTHEAQANVPIADAKLQLDETTQTFAQRMSIYRMYPASKSNTTAISNEILALNKSVVDLFAEKAATLTLAPSDKRGRYRLVGGVWLDKTRFFINDSDLQNSDYSAFPRTSPAQFDAGTDQEMGDSLLTNGTQSPFSILGGEDRLSGVATEPFSQQPGSFQNCSSCHNTQAVTSDGLPQNRVPGAGMMLKPGAINVSHVFSQMVLEDCGPSGACPAP